MIRKSKGARGEARHKESIKHLNAIAARNLVATILDGYT